MEGQTKLSGYFSTKKRGIEGVHPAKKRKISEVESGGNTSVPVVWKKANQASKFEGTARSNVRRSRRGKAPKGKEPLSNTEITSVLKRAGTRSSDKKTENVISETTSVSDDHAFEEALNGKCGEDQRKRKRPASKKVPSNKLEYAASQQLIKGSKSKDQASTKSAEKSSEARLPGSFDEGVVIAKKMRDTSDRLVSCNGNSEEKATRTVPDKGGSSLCNNNGGNRDAEQSEEGSVDQEVNCSLPSRRRPPVVKRGAGGLKLDPWISEQAKAVLFSRGKTAVAMSKRLHHGTKKDVNNGVGRDKRGKSVAHENLEKARELLRTMRSLESSAVKPKDVTTSERSESLHQLASDDSATASTLSSKKVPAFKRLHSLAEPTEPNLPLPYKYKVLDEMFNCTDTVLNLFGQRKATCTFPKLKDPIQKMSRKRFEKKHLAQMMTIYPSAFNCEQQQSLEKCSVYDLTVQYGSSKPTLLTSELISRRKVFRNNLLTLTKRHHQDFLSTVNPSVVVDDSKIIRWHPQFRLDSVPDIEQALLPEAPVVATFTTAHDVLSKACDLMAPRVKNALKNVSKKQEEMLKEATKESSDEKKQMTDAQTKTVAKNSTALKGISQDLLNKIRQKEAKKLEENMMRDPKIDRKLSMRERLPELCRILRTYFLTERKGTIPLEDATVKLSESYASSLSPVQVEEHMRMISELVPEWLAIVAVRRCQYVKVNKKADINCVINKLLAKEIS